MTLIIESTSLAAFCRRQEDTEFLTIDTEFLRDNSYWPKLCVVQLLVQLPVAKLRIMLHPVLGTLHRHCGHARCLASLHQIVFLKCLGPLLNTLVHLFLMLKTAAKCGELGRGSPFGGAHYAHQTPPFLLGEAGDGAPVVVTAALGAIAVMGRGDGARACNQTCGRLDGGGALRLIRKIHY